MLYLIKQLRVDIVYAVERCTWSFLHIFPRWQMNLNVGLSIWNKGKLLLLPIVLELRHQTNICWLLADGVLTTKFSIKHAKATRYLPFDMKYEQPVNPPQLLLWLLSFSYPLGVWLLRFYSRVANKGWAAHTKAIARQTPSIFTVYFTTVNCKIQSSLCLSRWLYSDQEKKEKVFSPTVEISSEMTQSRLWNTSSVMKSKYFDRMAFCLSHLAPPGYDERTLKNDLQRRKLWRI